MRHVPYSVKHYGRSFPPLPEHIGVVQEQQKQRSKEPQNEVCRKGRVGTGTTVYLFRVSIRQRKQSMFRFGRQGLQWWTQSDLSMLMKSQEQVFRLISLPFETARTAGMNAVTFKANTEDSTRPTCVIAHGFGSGLGFFYSSIPSLLASGQFGKIVLVDWLGMGGSDRPPCWNRPYRSFWRSSWCDSKFSSTEQSVNFFIDPLETFLETNHAEEDVVLVGHSLGGYLSARYALKYPSRIQKLVLASPVGFPHKPSDVLASYQMPTSFRLIDSLWSSNITPQALVRMQGGTRGKQNVRRVLRGRIPALQSTETDILADYLYHITVAPPSGEYAMNSLLEPAVSPTAMGVYAREPLESRMLELHTTIDLRVSFGDHDWMRPNEPSARKVVDALGNSRARLDIIPQAGHHLYLENTDAFVQTILT